MVLHANQHATVIPTPTPRGNFHLPIEDYFLNPALDGRALNTLQYDDSPECDSELEFILRDLDNGDIASARQRVLNCMHLNLQEGEQFRTIAGHADEASRQGAMKFQGRSGRRLVRELSGPLALLLVDPSDDRARDAVKAVVRSESPAAFQNRTLHKQLGKRKTTELFRQMGAGA